MKLSKGSKGQIEEYTEQGFVKLEGVLDEGWVTLLRRAIKRVENEADTRPRVANMSAMKEMADAGQRPRIDGPVRREGRSDYLVAHNAWDEHLLNDLEPWWDQRQVDTWRIGECNSR